jgi:ketosteroid isomerase-like protein
MTTEKQAVLTANDAFYSAFSNNNLANMEELWSAQHDIAIIHPGWPPLLGRESVLSSWKQIMQGGFSTNISCVNANANVLGNVALVICTELFAETELIATNVFVQEAGGWKMIHHQAGPLPLLNNGNEGDTLH